MSEGFVIENGKANFELCAKCGAAIKNVFWYRNKPYGSTCIQKVTGVHVDDWVIGQGGVIDEQATAERNQKRKEEQERWSAHINEQKRLIAEEKANEPKTTEENLWLIRVLEYQRGDFCQGMVDKLKVKKFNEQNFSNKMVSIMCDIYAKYHGRRNSKKYAAAEDFFWDKFERKI